MKCMACDADLGPSGRRQPHCYSESCVTAWVEHEAWSESNVRREGGCEVWTGRYINRRMTPAISAAIGRDGNNSIKRDHRVLTVRSSHDIGARRYDSLCNTFGCVVVDHHRPIIRPKVEHRDPLHRVRLPIEPLDAALARNPHTPLSAAFHERLKTGRKKGHISFIHADEICIEVLGVHPFAVYGELYFHA